MDLVRILETYCSDNDLEFRYGSKSHLNLLDGDLDEDKIYLLLFPVKRRNTFSEFGSNVKQNIFTGNFFLVKGSNYDLHYFNEREQDKTESKFTVHIEPLITIFKAIGKYLNGCGDDLEIKQWENIDAINVLDANKDGLWCSFQLNKDE